LLVGGSEFGVGDNSGAVSLGTDCVSATMMVFTDSQPEHRCNLGVKSTLGIGGI
jgi:hypothetical protein